LAGLKELVGPGYFNSDGTLKRRELRERIIQDPTLRRELDSLLHPYIIRAMLAERERQTALHGEAVIIFDIPLLFEGGFEKDFDIIILAYSSPTIQAQRLAQRDGICLREAERTLSMQFPIDSKKALCHYLIDNNGSLDQTLRQVDAIWKELTEKR
jgi:dephospho-CoA kinase